VHPASTACFIPLKSAASYRAGVKWLGLPYRHCL
jgi:hypothetical protein